MAKQAGKKFVWVIENFSSLQCKKCYSVPVQIGDCKWRLFAYPKGKNGDNLSLYLEVADFESLPSGWRRYANIRLAIVNKFQTKFGVLKEAYHWFDQKSFGLGVPSMIPLTKLHDEKEGFLVNGDLEIIAEVDVLEVIGTLDESDNAKEASNPLKKRKLNDDGVGSNDTLKEASSVKESIDVNGFQVLSSQVESVRLIFERYPDIAVEVRTKNQYMRNGCMNFLVSIIETLRQSLHELSNEDLVEADIALRCVKDAGFKVDWLEQKLNQVKKKKKKELSALAQLQKTEEVLLKLKEKYTELDVLAEEQKAELSATRAPLSLDDLI